VHRIIKHHGEVLADIGYRVWEWIIGGDTDSGGTHVDGFGYQSRYAKSCEEQGL
jgi:hypothetical protein